MTCPHEAAVGTTIKCAICEPFGIALLAGPGNPNYPCRRCRDEWLGNTPPSATRLTPTLVGIISRTLETASLPADLTFVPFGQQDSRLKIGLHHFDDPRVGIVHAGDDVAADDLEYEELLPQPWLCRKEALEQLYTQAAEPWELAKAIARNGWRIVGLELRS